MSEDTLSKDTGHRPYGDTQNARSDKVATSSTTASKLKAQNADAVKNDAEVPQPVPKSGSWENNTSHSNMEAGDGPSDIKIKTAAIKNTESTMDASLEDQMTNDKLVRLQQVFQEADEDGGGGLDMDEFRCAMRQTMGSNVSDPELDKIFMKVDTNCDGTVDWDEYLTYMLLECREKDQMQVEARQPFPRHLINIDSDHRDSIVSMLFIPHINPVDLIANQDTKPDFTQGRYLSTGRDGILTFWSADMKVLEQQRIEAEHGGTIWVTDCACLPSSAILAFSTTASTILFYNIGRKKFNRLIKLTRLDNCPVTMSMTMNKGLPTLLWGDDRGGISGLHFDAPAKLTAINPKTTKNGRERIPFAEFLSGQVKHVRGFTLPGIHGDGVRQIQYSQPLEAFISCSRDTDTAMFVGDLDLKLNKTYFSVPRGVNDFVYFKDLNVIVTGGYDAIVRVWNPYVPTKPVVMLRGHQSPILRVHINPVKEHIVSIAENKEIRVHDLNSQTCIQTFFRKMVTGLGPRMVSASVFQSHRQALVLATNKLALLEHHNEEEKHKQLMTHTMPLAAALYNPLFDQVVSAAADALVCVWCMNSGQKVMQFKAHTKLVNGEIQDVEITAITFDPTYRRLLTGAGDGLMKVWNFNNGACLRETQVCSHHREITSIVCARQYIVVGGWNKEVVLMKDKTEDEDLLYKLRPRLSDDILSLCFFPPAIIAAGTSDGLLYLWSLETRRLLLKAHVAGEVLSPCRMLVGGSEDKKRKPRQRTKEHTDQSSKSRRNTRLPYIHSGRSRQDVATHRAFHNSASKKPRFSLIVPNELSRTDCSIGPSEQEVKDAHMNELQVTLRRVLEQEKDFERENRPKCQKKKIIVPGKYSITDPDSIVAVEQLVFLSKREHSKDTASLFCACSDGFVRAWSAHPDGGLLGQFLAAHSEDSGVTAITTTEDNAYVITGDELGYIRVWDVTHFCLQGQWCTEKSDSERHSVWMQFAFYKLKQRLQRRQNSASPSETPSLMLSGVCDESAGCHLVNSFRGHLMWINSLDVATIGSKVIVLSASADCSVRMWTIKGQFLGIFGQENLWDAAMLRSHKHRSASTTPKKNMFSQASSRATALVPPDIRRVASAATLRVLFAHVSNPWMRTRVLFSWLTNFTRKQPEPSSEDVNAKPQDSEGEFSHQSDTSIHSPDSNDAVVDGEKSNLLGQSYKKLMRHRPLPSLNKPVVYGTQCAAYRCFPACSTEVHCDAPIPTENMQFLRDIQNRYSLPSMRRTSVVKWPKLRSHASTRKDIPIPSTQRRVSIVAQQPSDKPRPSVAEDSLLALFSKTQKEKKKGPSKKFTRPPSMQVNRRITLLGMGHKATKEKRVSAPGLSTTEETSAPRSQPKSLLPISEK